MMISRLKKKYKDRKISVSEITEACLARARKDTTNSFISIHFDDALKSAKSLDQKISARSEELENKPLFGVPLGIKDIFCTKGTRTTCASKILEHYAPPYNATVIERLERAGAVFIGKTNMDEFAMGGSNENSAFGPVKNPINIEYVAGGSSGGSAAVVAAGYVAGSLGTDTGGSIRLPASYTGVVGLKPTYGRVSRFGMIAFASSLDQGGPFARSVEDTANLFSTMAGYDPLDSTSSRKVVEDFWKNSIAQEGKRFRIGVPKEYFQNSAGLQAEVGERLSAALKFLSDSGHELVDISLPHTEYSVAVYYVVAVSEASSNLSRFDGVRFGTRKSSDRSLVDMYKDTRSLFGPEVKRRIILGTFALSSGYYDAFYKKACQVRSLIKRDFDLAFEKVDVVLAPVSPTTAFKLGEKTTDPLTMYLNDIFTIPANLAGLPALALPIGRDSKGLPIGGQLIGPAYSESKLFALGNIIEREFYAEPRMYEF